MDVKPQDGKAVWQSVTNVISVVALVFVAAYQLPEVRALVPAEWLPYLAAGYAIAMVLIRSLRTREPVTRLL